MFVLKKFYFIFILLFIGCVSGHCNKDGKPQTMDEKSQKVLVYKYDGSKQCEEGKGVDLDVMAKELGSIKIYGSEKKNDGQIRVQVCGALTGMTNAYKISMADLEKAEVLGFKKWDF